MIRRASRWLFRMPTMHNFPAESALEAFLHGCAWGLIVVVLVLGTIARVWP